MAGKERLAKQWLTIPWLELVAGHMVVSLVDNERRALDGYPVTLVYCLLMIVLSCSTGIKAATS